jgi:hypothetical protein
MAQALKAFIVSMWQFGFCKLPVIPRMYSEQRVPITRMRKTPAGTQHKVKNVHFRSCVQVLVDDKKDIDG